MRDKSCRRPRHLSVLGKRNQLLNWHGYDIGHSPGSRHASFAKWGLEYLRHDCGNDRHDPSLAVEYRRSRSTVVDGETVIALIHFQESGAREPAIGCVFYKSASH